MGKTREIMAAATPARGSAGTTGEWRAETPNIIKEKCLTYKSAKQTCQICWGFCPEAAIKRGCPPIIDLAYCKGCGICAEECPSRAIEMRVSQTNKTND